MHSRGSIGRGNRAERDEAALKPIGFAVAAIVAGVGAQAQAEPAMEAPQALQPDAKENVRTHYVDHTNHPGFEQDDTLVLGPSEPVEPFGAPVVAKQKQGDLFD